MADIELSVVVPVYNEEENLPELLRRSIESLNALDTNYELILVDDGSADKSREMIEKASRESDGKIVGVILAANFGQHAAVMAGLEASRGKYVVTMDADLQNPPEEIGKLLKELRDGVDVVGTIRENRQDTFFRKIASKCVNLLTRRLCNGRTMKDYGCMLRGYSRHVVNTLLRCQEHGKFIPMLAMSFARNVKEVHVKHAERAAGESKYNLMKLIALQYDLMTGTSIFPLRCLTFLGFLIALVGFVFGVYIFVRSQLDKGWGAEGVFALFAIQFVLTGGVFAALGLIGEYIGKIHINTRARPQYAIEDIVGRKDS